jgi:dihydrofolate reductase
MDRRLDEPPHQPETVMRKIIVSQFISLDGVIESPTWTFAFSSADREQYKLDEVMSAGALLTGRVTYEMFASAWPDMKDEAGFADQMNGMQKYMVSTTLEKGSWNNTKILRSPEELRAIKEQPGKDILCGGSGRLIESLKTLDLIDEYRLLVFPIILGKGQRLFQEGTAEQKLKLIDSRAFTSGATVLTYARV